LQKAAHNPHRDLYENNQAVYRLLRYGVPVKSAAGALNQTVHLIDWQHPERNDFVIAEEVTLKGGHERRPDLVLYVNGLALAGIELKRGIVEIGDAIRQNLSNQQPQFNAWFFSTVQFIFAGNDTQGLRYGAIGTEEKYFLTWKEDEADNTRFKLDKYLLKLCRKERLLELVHDFVLFDGLKKLPRVHQYFGLKAAQAYVQRRQGGIIWHTQGSGKSIVMVLLARWILEHNPAARVAIITDRDELDKQIERVFSEAGETIYRTSSGRDLLEQLGKPAPRLLCSLVHKFGHEGRGASEEGFEAFIKDLQARPSRTLGQVFVFVDECHRTQSGRLHRIMKASLPNAVFIGFTGTPLLKSDAQTTLELFGGYIHTYKFNEAVEDGVVLDLVYEARDIDQRLGSQEKIDAWFEAKTHDLNDWQKDELKKQWGTLQTVLSSRARMDQVVNDIVYDFSVKTRLEAARGNAMLVASSIYEACKYYSLFQKTPFKGRCALVTSYNPQAKDISLEDTGANSETDKEFIYNTYSELLKEVVARPNQSKTETYEDWAKERFVKDPAHMRLLVVVDKLLTGFDAPPCTYLYIDKSMQDHGLFQAICRTNRLDGEDKDFGYIVDYKDLFKKVEKAIAVYTAELDHSAEGADPEVLIKDRLETARQQLDTAIETLALLCEPVPPPGQDLQYIHYFCGNSELPDDLKAHAPQRVALYRAVAGLLRAYHNLADELEPAGYTPGEIARLKTRVDQALKLRQLIRQASGESLDLKTYEADMRYLIDAYIQADASRVISPFGNLPLLELIVKTGIAAAIAGELGAIKANPEAVAETIENNVRSKIIQDALTDPAYYARMSALLSEIIAARKAKAIEYEEYLQRIAALVKQVQAGHSDDTPEPLKHSPALRALYHDLQASPAKLLAGPPAPTPAVAEGQGGYSVAADPTLALAQQIDALVRAVRPDNWRGDEARERVILRALYERLQDDDDVERLFRIIKAQTEY